MSSMNPGLFHTRIRDLESPREQEKALRETLIKVKEYSLEDAARNLDPADIKGLQHLMEAKRSVQDLRKLHISVN